MEATTTAAKVMSWINREVISLDMGSILEVYDPADDQPPGQIEDHYDAGDRPEERVAELVGVVLGLYQHQGPDQEDRQSAKHQGRRAAFAGQGLHLLAKRASRPDHRRQAVQDFRQVAARLGLDPNADGEEVGVRRAGATGKAEQGVLEIGAVGVFVDDEPEFG